MQLQREKVPGGGHRLLPFLKKRMKLKSVTLTTVAMNELKLKRYDKSGDVLPLLEYTV